MAHPPRVERLVIYPRRVVRVGMRQEASRERRVYEERAQQRWARRDAVLLKEFDAVLVRVGVGAPSLQAPKRTFSLRGLLPSRSVDPPRRPPPAPNPATRTWSDGSESVTHQSRLLTYAVALPLLLGSASARATGASPALSMCTAATSLFEDRLFCLSLFFGVPLMDRTQTLQGPVRTAIVTPSPTAAEVAAFAERSRTACPPGADPCVHSFDTACMARARHIWAESEADPKRFLDVAVMWSGGIDSTLALVCLLRAAEDIGQRRRERLVVVLDEKSIGEYPFFHENFINKSGAPGLRSERLDNQSLASVARRTDRLSVTGELGDQLFGSDRCYAAFVPVWPPPPQILPEADTGSFLPQQQPSYAKPPNPNWFTAGLHAPWQETLLPALEDKQLLCGSRAEWEAWIQPQLAAAPFPIRSTFDMLWWLNFSCKWQQVQPLPAATSRNVASSFSSPQTGAEAGQQWHARMSAHKPMPETAPKE